MPMRKPPSLLVMKMIEMPHELVLRRMKPFINKSSTCFLTSVPSSADSL
jgi:hypothetical protein